METNAFTWSRVSAGAPAGSEGQTPQLPGQWPALLGPDCMSRVVTSTDTLGAHIRGSPHHAELRPCCAHQLGPCSWVGEGPRGSHVRSGMGPQPRGLHNNFTPSSFPATHTPASCQRSRVSWLNGKQDLLPPSTPRPIILLTRGHGNGQQSGRSPWPPIIQPSWSPPTAAPPRKLPGSLSA